MQRSFAQILLFMSAARVVVALPGPKVLAMPLGRLLHLVWGVWVGKVLLGYKESYQEYCSQDDSITS